jgi:hypothetical protein
VSGAFTWLFLSVPGIPGKPTPDIPLAGDLRMLRLVGWVMTKG